MLHRRKFLSLAGFASFSAMLAACGIDPSSGNRSNPVPPSASGLVVFGETILGIDPPGWEVLIEGTVGMGGVVFKSTDGRSYLVRQITYTLLNAGMSPVALNLRNFSLSKGGQMVSTTLASLSGNRLVFDLADPLVVPGDGKTVGLELGAEVVGELGAVFQFGIAASADIVATDAGGSVVAASARGGAFPVKLLYMQIVVGGFKVGRAINSPSGVVKLPPNTPNQVVLVTDIQALGEDLYLNNMVVAFRLAGLRAADLANLRVSDQSGMQLGFTAVVPDAESLRLKIENLRYLIRRNETRQLYVYMDTKPGAAGSIQGIFLGDISGEGAASMHYVGGYAISGNDLSVG